MVGSNNSCYSRLKDTNPSIFLSKCVCHVAATCSSNAAKCIPDSVEELIHQVWTYFAMSGARCENYQLFCKFTDIEPMRLLKPAQTRWLSLEGCVSRVLAQWENLVAFFNSSSDKQAKSIKKRLTPQNRLYLMFLDSTLPLFNRFDKMFQVNGNAC